MTTPLITIDDIKAHLPIRVGNTNYDDRLNLLIETATDQIQTATEREFESASRTEDFDTPITGNYVYDFYGTTNEHGLVQLARPAHYTLRALNIDANTLQVFYDPTREFPATSEVDAANLVLDAAKGFLSVRVPMVRTVGGLRVTYTGGYASGGDPVSLRDSIPADLKLACITQVLYMWSRLDPTNVGRMSEKKEGEGANMFNTTGGLTPEAQALLVSYRAMRMSRD